MFEFVVVIGVTENVEVGGKYLGMSDAPRRAVFSLEYQVSVMIGSKAGDRDRVRVRI